VGDWGTQFGMLLEHLKDNTSQGETAPIADLQAFYKVIIIIIILILITTINRIINRTINMTIINIIMINIVIGSNNQHDNDRRNNETR
jgi:hypothetical protein